MTAIIEEPLLVTLLNKKQEEVYMKYKLLCVFAAVLFVIASTVTSTASLVEVYQPRIPGCLKK